MLILLVSIILILLYLVLYYRKRYQQHLILAYDYIHSYNKLCHDNKIADPPCLSSHDRNFRNFLLNYYNVSDKSLMHRESELMNTINILLSVFNEKHNEGIKS